MIIRTKTMGFERMLCWVMNYMNYEFECNINKKKSPIFR